MFTLQFAYDVNIGLCVCSVAFVWNKLECLLRCGWLETSVARLMLSVVCQLMFTRWLPVSIVPAQLTKRSSSFTVFCVTDSHTTGRGVKELLARLFPESLVLPLLSYAGDVLIFCY